MLGKDSNGTKPESKVSFEVAGPLQPAPKLCRERKRCQEPLMSEVIHLCGRLLRLLCEDEHLKIGVTNESRIGPLKYSEFCLGYDLMKSTWVAIL